MTAVIGPGLDRDAGLTVLDGELPAGPDEVAIGATTADDRGIGVGDVVDIGAYVDTRPATVTGIVVFPTIGPFGADRVSVGNGLLLPDAFFDADELAVMRDFVSGLAAFVGVELRDEARTPATLARLRAAIGDLDRFGVPALTYTEPVRPAEIIDAANITSLPITVGIAFALVAVVGLASASWASVRARRRELAVLRSLGFGSRQIRHTVWVQSVATMVGALVVGVPLGVAAGRQSWRAFAEGLGVVPDPASPTIPLLLSVLSCLVIALLAAQVPADVAARTSPAAGLRAE
jgi:putative ABC transport system permease protein